MKTTFSTLFLKEVPLVHDPWTYPFFQNDIVFAGVINPMSC